MSTDLFNLIKSDPASAPTKKDSLTLAWEDWNKTKTPEAFDTLIGHADPVIRQAAVTHAGGESPNVLSRGRILAANAVKTYSPTAGTSLRGWLMTNLQGLSRYRNKLTPFSRPERVALDASRVYAATRELEAELGRTPSQDEVAKATNLSLKRIKHVHDYGAPTKAESEIVDEDGDSYLPGAAGSSPQAIWAQLVYHDLDPVNQRIYDMALGRSGHKKGLLTSEIAAKLGISSSAVSQRARQIAEKLESGMPSTDAV